MGQLPEPVKNRNPYWDNFKGVMIALVVLGHFLWDYWGLGLAGSLVSFIYLFHMPAFIFIAGYMSKSNNARSQDSLLKLGVIYVLFNSSIMLFSYALFDTPFQLITPQYSTWFLIALILWRLSIQYLDKVESIMLISVIAAFLIGLWGDVTNVFALARTVVFFPFFIAGYTLPEDKFTSFILKRKPANYIKGILLLAVTILLAILFLDQYTGLSQSCFLMSNYDQPRDFIVRLGILSIAALMTISLSILMPKNPLPLLCKWGKNSLSIYVFHRFITLVLAFFLPKQEYTPNYVVVALGATVLTLAISGSDSVSKIFNRIIDRVFAIVSGCFQFKQRRLGHLALVLTTVVLLLPLLKSLSQVASETMAKVPQDDIIHQVMQAEHEAALEDAVTIAFVGDLILLQDQVRMAYLDTAGKYDFEPMFEYAAPYLAAADLAIGIFEGPAAGEDAGYSTSNFDDGLPLSLNYPDSFAWSVKNSGIDIVSTANNHLLDKGEEGVVKTLDILDEVGLLHVGSYRNAEERCNNLILEVKGVRIAFLAYTYGSNGYSEEYFLRENPSLTSILVSPASKYFQEVKTSVLSDFQQLKGMSNPPDIIAVLPHMGTQFSHKTDAFQETWNDIFINAGADIILGDHAHAVQPIEFTKAVESKEKQGIIVNCPGNFVNSYVEKNGDATSIVEVYIDPHRKEVICAGVIPMYTQAPANGDYRALPIYCMLNDPLLQSQVSKYEMKRVAEVQAIVTSVMLNAELSLDQAQDRYYLFPQGYVRQRVNSIEVTEEIRDRDLYKLLSAAGSVCFVGDSITAGSKNGGYGWDEPLMAAFPDSVVHREAWGSATTKTLLENAETIASYGADLYVIAIGTNDVRYRNKQMCAMSPSEYVSNIDLLVSKIMEYNEEANFVFISPWLALDNDPCTMLSNADRDMMLAEYGEDLRLYCEAQGHCYLNPNPAISEVLKKYPPKDYLLDHIHPNPGAGIVLYSQKVLTD